MIRTQTAQSSPLTKPAPSAVHQLPPAKSEAPDCSPQQAPWRGVGKALEGRVLGSQEEGEDGSGACAQGVAHHYQAVVFGSAALGTERSPESPAPLPAKLTPGRQRGLPRVLGSCLCCVAAGAEEGPS